MLHRDYFMRQMEQVIRLLQMAFGLINLRNYPEALNVIDGGFQQFFGFDSKFANAMPLEYLISMMKQGGVLDADSCLLMASLLKAEGDIYEALGDDEGSYHRYLRSLHLRVEVFESQRPHSSPESWADVDEMVEKLAEFDLPTETQGRLLNYYDAVGQYAKAEDVLWEWLEATEYVSDAVERGMIFYQQLLTKSNAVLKAGKLPRAEVKAGLAELMAFKE